MLETPLEGRLNVQAFELNEKRELIHQIELKFPRHTKLCSHMYQKQQFSSVEVFFPPSI